VDSLGFIVQRVNPASKLMTDEATSWNALYSGFDVSRIDHGKLYSDRSGVYTNGAEEFFSRMRRAEIGHHHHIAGKYGGVSPNRRKFRLPTISAVSSRYGRNC
jgi:hypothetical protein